jgi:biotin synthase
LLFKAQVVHRQNFRPNEIQLSTLLSIKTGTCPENCGYCPQSAHFNTGIKKEKLLEVEEVVKSAQKAKDSGATRFCMGAAWRSPPKKDLPKVLEMIKAVKNLGLETCVTLGMLDAEQAMQLKAAGLDYYNHNLDTSPEYYTKIVSTRTYQERLDTLEHVRNADIHVCCGGILGLGEAREDRIGLLLELANLPEQPKSVPIGHLAPTSGVPLEKTPPLDHFEFIRSIAVARIMMPRSMLRIAAGRDKMPDEMQVLCFMAGANSVFFGEALFITSNPFHDKDREMIEKIGIKIHQDSYGLSMLNEDS